MSGFRRFGTAKIFTPPAAFCSLAVRGFFVQAMGVLSTMKKYQLHFMMHIDRTPADAHIDGHVQVGCTLAWDYHGDFHSSPVSMSAITGLPTGKRLVEAIVRWAKMPNGTPGCSAMVRRSDIRRVLRLAMTAKSEISVYGWNVHHIKDAC